MKQFIQLNDVSFKYKQGSNVVSNVNIDIESGEFIAIIGHNGCGKSTLSKLFNALLIPTKGTVLVDNVSTSDRSKNYDIKRKVGLVQQNPDNQIVASIVEEDVAFGPENLGLPSDEIRKRVDYALNCVDMYDLKDKSTYKLSGGQKQRVAIAGIIAMQPKCIILDEPTSMLDPSGRKEVISTLTKLNKENNITIILITHYMDEAALADRVIIFNDGKVLMQGTPSEAFSHVSFLKQHKLDVPQVTALSQILIDNGYDLPAGIVNEDEFVNLIVAILGED